MSAKKNNKGVVKTVQKSPNPVNAKKAKRVKRVKKAKKAMETKEAKEGMVFINLYLFNNLNFNFLNNSYVDFLHSFNFLLKVTTRKRLVCAILLSLSLFLLNMLKTDPTKMYSSRQTVESKTEPSQDSQQDAEKDIQVVENTQEAPQDEPLEDTDTQVAELLAPHQSIINGGVRQGPKPKYARRENVLQCHNWPRFDDFNRDGVDEIHDGFWYIDLNGNGIWDEGDMIVKPGTALDQPEANDAVNEFLENNEP